MSPAFRLRASALLATLLVAACGPASDDAPSVRAERPQLTTVAFRADVEGGDVVAVAPTWSARLTGDKGHRATVRVVPLGDTAVRATIELAGSEASGRHPWHLHRGDCDDDLGIVGNPRVYVPLTGEGTGPHRATATIPVTLDAKGSYFAALHSGGARVACGKLVPDGDQ